MTTEPNNQELACLVVLDDLSERLGEFIDVVGRPDEEERQLEAMDMLARSESRQFAIEHTRIESFSGQIADGVAFVKLLVSLETELFAGLAGHYWLTVPADASASVRAKDTEGVRGTIKKWVAEAATALEAEDLSRRQSVSITAKLEGVPFSVTLTRTRLPGNCLRILRNTPTELEELRGF